MVKDLNRKITMIKRALLITNPGEKGADNFCRGVYVDVENYRQHLTSAVGGAWEEKEIIHLDRPSVALVRQWLVLPGKKWIF